MSDTYKTLLIERDDGIVAVTVNRPQALNALSKDVLTELQAMLLTEAETTQTQGIILQGAGEKAFIAGADIAMMHEMTPTEAETLCTLGQDVTRLLEDMPFPVIACVQGFALGGGCEMALACDFIYATEDSTLGQPETLLGLIPGFGGCARLPKRIGLSKAKDLILSGRKVSATEALEIGLVDRLFNNNTEMIAAAKKFIQKTRKASPSALKVCKRLLGNTFTDDTDLSLIKEKEEFVWIFAKKDRTEGLSAFLEKRSPKFSERR